MHLKLKSPQCTALLLSTTTSSTKSHSFTSAPLPPPPPFHLPMAPMNSGPRELLSLPLRSPMALCPTLTPLVGLSKPQLTKFSKPTLWLPPGGPLSGLLLLLTIMLPTSAPRSSSHQAHLMLVLITSDRPQASTSLSLNQRLRVTLCHSGRSTCCSF